MSQGLQKAYDVGLILRHFICMRVYNDSTCEYAELLDGVQGHVNVQRVNLPLSTVA